MNQRTMRRIFKETDFPHVSGTKEELRVAEYLKAECEKLGVPARIEGFRVAMANIKDAHVYADGREIPCKALYGCGSGEVEAELYYAPSLDKVTLAGAKGKILLLDTQGVGFFAYKDIVAAGAVGLLFRYGELHWPNRDIDQRDLREAVVGEEKKLLCAMLNSETAVSLVRNGVKRVKIAIQQDEFDGESRNVVAELPGETEEYITLTAHYDSTALSHGSYDNMSGCVGLLGIMEALKAKKHRCGLRFVFCGSEERGLLGSKAYVADHEAEIEKTALNINLDMIGTYMGKFISVASAEDKLPGYISYMGAELGFPVSARAGVYSSDSTPFADKGVPAVSFARMAMGGVAPIHCRYDTPEVLSMEQMGKDIAFITEFTRRMADSAVCPVAREIPDKIRGELDEYLFRKRKESDR